MAIKDEAAFQELKPYLKMTVAPNGVTIGDLNFVVAMTHHSTALQAIAAGNTLPADMVLDLFQGAQGDVAQGFTTALTRSQTSWLDTGGRLPANQVFIATSCGFQVFRRSVATTGVTNVEALIPKVSAVEAIGRNLSWDVTIGDGITRNYGPLGNFGGFASNYELPNYNQSVTTNAGPPISVATVTGNVDGGFPRLGSPCDQGRKLRIPLVFPPNIGVRIRVRNGVAFTVDDGADGTDPLPTTFLAVRQYLHGYLCTMPVG